MNQIETIINKFLNIQIISIDCPARNITTFDLYDYLDKPGNFEHDVKIAANEIKKAYPTCNVELKFYNDSYWDGEEMTETYNCILGIIKEE